MMVHSLPQRRSIIASKSRPSSFQSLMAIIVMAAALPLTMMADGPSVGVQRHAPNNLFSPDEVVAFEGVLKGFPAGQGTVNAKVKNFEGESVWSQDLPVEVVANQKPTFKIEIGKLPYGYYELGLSAKLAGTDGKETVAGTKSSFGVIAFQSRTAAEVRAGNYAFGLKWWGGVSAGGEALTSMQKSGFQWTRLIMSGDKIASVALMSEKYQINVVMKVERFPKELYDEQKYGPMEEWEKKYGKGAWTLKTLPKKEEYQKMLAEKLATIPKEQNVFEIWNEPWDKMSPEDFAMLSQWIADVILKDRPNAIIGPNLMGRMGEYEYDSQVIKAGGLKGMKMVALHPYAGSEDREWLRQYEEWLKKETGRDMDIYVTECGSHSTPEGPAKRSEAEQARRTVRQGISLYAENVKAILPHWLGQSEQNKTYIEDWFGFIRKNEEVKPVWVAFAAAARMVDSQRYVGDLWYGPRVAAMLFEKSGKYTMVLWTLRGDEQKEDQPAQKEVEIDTGVPSVTEVTMMGTEKTVKTNGGKLSVTVTEAPMYLSGVSPALEKQASKELRADRFPKPEKAPRITREVAKAKGEIAFDGKFDDWKGAFELSMVNPKVAGADCSGIGYLLWDDTYLYVGVNIKDNEMLNNQPGAKLYRQDSMELWVTTEPREEGGGYGPKDKQFFVTPTSGEGKPVFAWLKQAEAGVLEEIPGSKFRGGKTADGWALQVGIPWTYLGFKPKAGEKIALNLRVNDSDTSHERWKIDPEDAAQIGGGFNGSDPTTWPYLLLKD